MSKRELLVSKASVKRIQDEIRQAMPLKENVDSLLGLGLDEITDVIMRRDKKALDIQVANILGSLKGNYDILPEDIAEQEKYNGISLDKAIKMRIWQILCFYPEDRDKYIKSFECGYKTSLNEALSEEQACIKLIFQINPKYFGNMEELSYSTWAPESESTVHEVLKKRKPIEFSHVTFCL